MVGSLSRGFCVISGSQSYRYQDDANRALPSSSQSLKKIGTILGKFCMLLHPLNTWCWNMGVMSSLTHTYTMVQLRCTVSRALDSRAVTDGRMFFSAAGSYPCEVFSIIRYEPKKEEAARRRKKLEARGGGGSEFIVPARDWRGISYRALLPVRHQKQDHLSSSRRRKSNDNSIMLFDRFQNHDPSLSNNNKSNTNKTASTDGSVDTHEEDDDSDDEPDTYVPGLLDDPAMVLGRHRNVMIGDRSTGCIVASTIQFVQPTLLKSNLNKQFRERFDGWEPPKVQRKFIGARIVDGVYTLMEDDEEHKKGGQTVSSSAVEKRKRQNSVTSISGADASEIIRMPPSLTLSKIRSLKQQALRAAVKARLEISTVALAIVYFERLCLDCRIDKTNRRLSFAACLLLAVKINESHVILATDQEDKSDNKTSSIIPATKRIQSLYRSTKKSNNTFSLLLEFFTQEWEISLKHLFSAEWGVFAALQFRLHVKPSQVAFHFKRLLKSLGWNPRRYLGGDMFSFWQMALTHEEYLRQERQVRLEIRQQKEKEKLMQLQREMGRKESIDGSVDVVEESNNEKEEPEKEKSQPTTTNYSLEPKKHSRLTLSLLNRFGTGANKHRSSSTERIPQRTFSTPQRASSTATQRDDSVLESGRMALKLAQSPSMPLLSNLLPKDHGHSDLGSARIPFSNNTADNAASSTQQEHLDRGEDDAESMSEHSETSIIMI
mmetsp:Transcript_33880/g.82150  ORF Transcript_33880/g.82150 Transcript_33880/m.82150 type:complete len:718 (+) Transcript_33880:922-3075(+)